MSKLRPRLCVLEKGPGGYGFHLHGEKGKTGQFIRLVEPDTPAESAGLLAGDRLAFVNGESVEGEGHQQVVAKIRATSGALELIVVDPETSELLKKHGLPCRKEFVTEGIPLPGGDGDSDRGDAHSGSGSPRGSSPRGGSPVGSSPRGGSPRGGSPVGSSPRGGSPAPAENGDASSVRSERVSVTSKDDKVALRPRLCHMKRGPGGYGFNLHSDKSRPGQYIRAVDEDSPAEKAGLRPQDKIIQVNGKPVLAMQHSEVVGIIKSGGDETTLLVVDAETEEFFKKCNVVPTEQHITVCCRGGAQSVRELVSFQRLLRRPPGNQRLPGRGPEGPRAGTRTSPDSRRAASRMTLAQARERAHQKRAAKKAPPMDWSKRNELFSNL